MSSTPDVFGTMVVSEARPTSKSWITLFAGRRPQKSGAVSKGAVQTIKTVSEPDISPKDIKNNNNNNDTGSGSGSDMARRPLQQHATRPLRQRTYNRFRLTLDSFSAVYGSDGPRLYWEHTIKDTKRAIVAAKTDRTGVNANKQYATSTAALEKALERNQEAYEFEKKCTMLVLREPPARGLEMVHVAAPPDRGVSGYRVIWAKRMEHTRACVKDKVDEMPIPNPKNMRLVNINGKKVMMKKYPFDAEYVWRKDEQGQKRVRKQIDNKCNEPTCWSKDKTCLACKARRPSRLSSLSVTAEDVEYPVFTQEIARWTTADLGQSTVYDALSAHIAALTRQYNWEGEVWHEAISVIDQLRSRPDLTVPCGNGYQVSGQEIPDAERVKKMATKRLVTGLTAKLRRMARVYDEAVKEFGDAEGTDRPNICAGRNEVKGLERLVEILLAGQTRDLGVII
ncbi:hypothetical protein PV05_11924 [Exophiala xenobiotica]|uniref:Uncharacterized protein n=1 Tax=Exophiala xenobiotica TaxID=348802 RepID=A0A0D2CKF7_9EURO|nr:uncharacterized protein PV05_11924 [Exophiala xenobiotica]KIW50327.1 hypothetical protein PV05_11924 [Exophiala xenobiotica]